MVQACEGCSDNDFRWLIVYIMMNGYMLLPTEMLDCPQKESVFAAKNIQSGIWTPFLIDMLIVVLFYCVVGCCDVIFEDGLNILVAFFSLSGIPPPGGHHIGI